MTTSSLKARLASKDIVLVPGVYDALSALVAEQAGFEALYLSGASIAYTRLGRSDIGLTTFTEVPDTLSHITERVRVPVIVDADTGFTARAVVHTLQGYYASLRQHRTTQPWRDRMLDFDGLNAVIGTPELMRAGQQYD